MKKCVVCLTFLMFALPAWAVDYTGFGADPSNWADSANWSADPTDNTANVNGAFTVNAATDTINSLRIGYGADVTLPAGVTLTSNVSESSGMGWWSGDPSSLTVEGTWEFSANGGNLWLSDAFNSGPSTLIVRGNAVMNIGGAILSARDDASMSVEGNAIINVPNDGLLLPYHDFGAGTLSHSFNLQDNAAIIVGGSFGFAGDSVGVGTMSGGLLDVGSMVSGDEDTFTFSGGTIKVDGNQLPWNSARSWFVVGGPNADKYFEEYDAGEDKTILAFMQVIGVTASEGGNVVREEGPTSDSFEVVLLEAPDADVTVTLDPQDPNDDYFLNAEAPNSAITLTFTTANWDTPQSVTVTAVDDDEPEPAEQRKIVITGDSTDADFVTALQTSVTIIDNDSASVIIEESDGSTDVVEGGASDTYTVVLGFPPTADVTVTVDDLGDPNQTLLNGGETVALTFTAANWDTPQTITVEAIDDDAQEGDPHVTTLGHTVSQSGGDMEYGGISAGSVIVLVGENDCGAGPFNVSDFDQNCITDLVDFANFVSEFLLCSITTCP